MTITAPRQERPLAPFLSRTAQMCQLPTHRRLLTRTGLTPVSGRARMDAIIVPAGREARHLDDSIALAVQSDVLLVILCSRKAVREQVVDRITRIAGVRAVVIDVPDRHILDHQIILQSGEDSEIVKAQAGRDSDLSPKRNLGLMLARVMSWDRILYLDDDIRGLKPVDVSRLAGALDSHSVAGMLTRRFPDNSVVCHANRLSGASQDVFASGSVLAVDTTQADLPFFPDVYNEDWFFFAEHAAARKLAYVGYSRQLDFDPFRDSSRAAREEFGDTLAEGLYRLIEDGRRSRVTSESFWDEFATARKQFLEDASVRLEHLATPEAYRAIASISAAQAQLTNWGPFLYTKFAALWESDLHAWRDALNSLPRLHRFADAADHLRLTSYTTIGLPIGF